MDYDGKIVKKNCGDIGLPKNSAEGKSFAIPLQKSAALKNF